MELQERGLGTPAAMASERTAALVALPDLAPHPSAHQGRIRLYVSGYRSKRRDALERVTRQIAEEVRTSGVAKSLEPMHPADRKVVHDTVNEIDGVSTTSEGEEPRRRVVILPAED